LKEWQMRELENDIESLVSGAKQIGLSKLELKELIDLYFEEDVT